MSLDKYGTNIVANSTSFSKIGYYTNTTYTKTTGNAPEPFVIKDVFDGTDVNAIDTINTYFNYDVRSLGNSTNQSQPSNYLSPTVHSQFLKPQLVLEL